MTRKTWPPPPPWVHGGMCFHTGPSTVQRSTVDLQQACCCRCGPLLPQAATAASPSWYGPAAPAGLPPTAGSSAQPRPATAGHAKLQLQAAQLCTKRHANTHDANLCLEVAVAQMLPWLRPPLKCLDPSLGQAWTRQGTSVAHGNSDEGSVVGPGHTIG